MSPAYRGLIAMSTYLLDIALECSYVATSDWTETWRLQNCRVANSIRTQAVRREPRSGGRSSSQTVGNRPMCCCRLRNIRGSAEDKRALTTFWQCRKRRKLILSHLA